MRSTYVTPSMDRALAAATDAYWANRPTPAQAEDRRSAAIKARFESRFASVAS